VKHYESLKTLSNFYKRILFRQNALIFQNRSATKQAKFPVLKTGQFLNRFGVQKTVNLILKKRQMTQSPLRLSPNRREEIRSLFTF